MREIHPTEPRPPAEAAASEHRAGTFPRLKWAITQYGWVVVLFAVAAGFLATRLPVATGATTYEAAAVVTARQLVIDPENLPRTAGAIFNAGEVARTAVELAEVDYNPTELIPDRVRLEPVENTVVLRVVATDPEPEVAAALANGAARALVMEMQRLGAGVGQFGLHTEATVPEEPIDDLPVPALLVGVLAGLIFGIGVAGLAMALRRPVLDGATAGTLSRLPVLGTIALSSLDSTGDLRSVPRLEGLTDSIFPRRNERRYLVGVNVRPHSLRLLGIVLVRTLARSGKRAALVGEKVTREVFGTEAEGEFLIAHESQAPSRSTKIATVVLGRFVPDADGVSHSGASDASVLVVGQGTPAHRLVSAVEELGGTHLMGLVLLRPLGWRDIQRRNDPHIA